MTLVQVMQDNVANGTAATSSNLTGTTTGGFTVTSPSTLTWVTDSGAGTGKTVLHYAVSTATDITRWALNATNDQVAISLLVKVPGTAPTTNAVVMSIRYASGVAARFGFNASNRPYMMDSVSTQTFIAAAGVLSASTWYRFEFLIHGNSTTAGTMAVNVYTPTGTTPVASMTTVTNANLTANTLAAVEIGNSAGTQAIDFAAANLQFDNGRTTEIGPLSAALTQPTVTLGASTTPTTVGGTNGTQVVTWPAVSGATSYEAWITKNDPNDPSPLQADFTLVATGVTSPYTFTNLSQANYDFGIKAKA